MFNIWRMHAPFFHAHGENMKLKDQLIWCFIISSLSSVFWLTYTMFEVTITHYFLHLYCLYQLQYISIYCLAYQFVLRWMFWMLITSNGSLFWFINEYKSYVIPSSCFYDLWMFVCCLYSNLLLLISISNMNLHNTNSCMYSNLWFSNSLTIPDVSECTWIYL